MLHLLPLEIGHNYYYHTNMPKPQFGFYFIFVEKYGLSMVLLSKILTLCQWRCYKSMDQLETTLSLSILQDKGLVGYVPNVIWTIEAPKRIGVIKPIPCKNLGWMIL